MKLKTSPWFVLAAFTAASVGAIALPEATLAQTCSDAQSLQGCPSPNERGSFSGGGGGDLSVYDLIHRAQMGTLTNMDDFTAEQRQNLDSAADTFREQQLQRMKEAQQQAAPANPASNPAPQN